jgi:hypothetical protein
MASRGYSSDFIETLRNKGDAIQLDQPDPGAVVGTGDFQRRDDFPLGGRGRHLASIRDSAGRGLHRVLWHHNIALPALPVLALFGATNDRLQGLPAWVGARRSGIRIVDIDCLGQQWSRPPDQELLCILSPLGCRSDHGAVSASRADNGWAVLVVGKATDRRVGARAVIVTM